jgi:hypothetical protein
MIYINLKVGSESLKYKGIIIILLLLSQNDILLKINKETSESIINAYNLIQSCY